MARSTETAQCRGRGCKETQKEGDVRKTSHVGSDTSDTLQSNSFTDPKDKDWVKNLHTISRPFGG